MNCPNINNEQVRNEFNKVLIAFGGNPMTIEEFKSKEVRDERSGIDDSAMQLAYYAWDKTNGEGIAALPEYTNSMELDESTRIRKIVNGMLGIDESSAKTPNDPHANAVRANIINSLPKEVSDAVEVVSNVPEDILGRDDLYLSMKDILEEKGISDPMLINLAWYKQAGVW